MQLTSQIIFGKNSHKENFQINGVIFKYLEDTIFLLKGSDITKLI